MFLSGRDCRVKKCSNTGHTAFFFQVVCGSFDDLSQVWLGKCLKCVGLTSNAKQHVTPKKLPHLWNMTNIPTASKHVLEVLTFDQRKKQRKNRRKTTTSRSAMFLGMLTQMGRPLPQIWWIFFCEILRVVFCETRGLRLSWGIRESMKAIQIILIKHW